MSRRDQPYIPLYVMDFLTDEKLRECSAESVGVYIMLMCVMHKQEEYGTIVLREKDRKSGDTISNFASKLAKHLPFGEEVIKRAIQELLNEGVLHADGDKLIQKRMVRDADISEKRAAAGKKGSVTTNSKFDNPEPALAAPPPEIQDPELAKAADFYLNRINPTPSQTSLEELAAFVKQMGADVCIAAMEYALDERKAKWSYIRGVLRGYNREGIRNISDLQRSKAERERDKQEQGGTQRAADRRGAGGYTSDYRQFKPSGGFKEN